MALRLALLASVLLLAACPQRIDPQEPPDAAAPGLDAALAGLDAAPGPDAQAPGLDAALPGPDAAEPGPDAAEPGPDAAEPGLDAAAAGPDACTPKTCAEAPLACGPVSDGCGALLDCSCPYTLGCDADAGSCVCDPAPRVHGLDATGGLFVSLSVDAEGGLHAASTHVDGSEVRHGYAAPGPAWTFTSEVVESTVDPKLGFRGTGLVVAPDGALHLVYLRLYSASASGSLQDVELWYATRAPQATSWSRAKALSLGRQANVYSDSVSLVRDAQGALHAAFVDYTRSPLVGDVAHAELSAGSSSWTVETVFEGATVSTGYVNGGTPSLAVEPQGGLHLAFHDYATRSLRYASRPAAGTWAVDPTPVAAPSAPGERVGYVASLAVASDGTRHLSWVHSLDSTHQVLRYAQAPAGGAWTPEDVDPAGGASGSAGYPNALAVDEAAGTVHVLYGAAGAVRWGRRDASGWTLTPLDPATKGLAFPALLVDPRGTLFLGYGDWVSESRATLKLGHRCR